MGFLKFIFQILSLYNDIVNSIDLVRSGGYKSVITTSGRDCFPIIRERLKNKYSEITDFAVEKEIIERACDKFYEAHKVELIHYFCYLYNIFKFLNKAGVEDKRFYGNLFGAKISRDELVIIFITVYPSMLKRGFVHWRSNNRHSKICLLVFYYTRIIGLCYLSFHIHKIVKK